MSLDPQSCSFGLGSLKTSVLQAALDGHRDQSFRVPADLKALSLDMSPMTKLSAATKHGRDRRSSATTVHEPLVQSSVCESVRNSGPRLHVISCYAAVEWRTACIPPRPLRPRLRCVDRESFEKPDGNSIQCKLAISPTLPEIRVKKT